jgi:hypothetical protein
LLACTGEDTRYSLIEQTSAPRNSKYSWERVDGTGFAVWRGWEVSLGMMWLCRNPPALYLQTVKYGFAKEFDFV